MTADIWATVHAERAALAADLEGLQPGQWSTPSLCARWSVLQILAHLVSTAKMSPSRFVWKMAASGFRFTSMTDKEVRAEARGGPAVTLAEFRAVESSMSAPPGPKDSWLGEILVHAEDIRRPLGITHTYPLSSVTRAIDFYAGSNALIGGKRRVAGLTLQATDVDWSSGSGPVVAGPAVGLLLAATGRAAALADLSGPGLDVLRSR